jgi:hypothetical protein
LLAFIISKLKQPPPHLSLYAHSRRRGRNCGAANPLVIATQTAKIRRYAHRRNMALKIAAVLTLADIYLR